MTPCGVFDSGAQGPVDPDAGAPARSRGHLGPRSVGRKFQEFGDTGEFLAPESDLGGRDRVRIGLVAEHRALPDREVRVLDLQRGPAG
ncbi:hypothetical protein GCM10009855_08340 [Gordonia cholesterolivorans]|uniref:Uncharacterized protein n=1 Tax=Gordonia cholesterolivorans TaxID=559625 RepID=A0ABN3H7F4_9ACTN